MFINTSCFLNRPGQGLLLGRFIRSFENRVGYVDVATFGSLLVLSFLAFIFAFQHSTFLGSHIAMKMRVATTTIIYRKVCQFGFYKYACVGGHLQRHHLHLQSLKLTQRQLEETGVGKITNMLTSEVSLFEYGVQYTPYVSSHMSYCHFKLICKMSHWHVKCQINTSNPELIDYPAHLLHTTYGK